MEAEEYKEERWVMALHGEDPQGRHAGKVKFLLWDSGSDEHLCRPQFGGEAHNRPCGAKLMGISGVCLGELGEKRVRYKIIAEAGFHVHAETKFKVSRNASKDVLSAGKCVRPDLQQTSEIWSDHVLSILRLVLGSLFTCTTTLAV